MTRHKININTLIENNNLIVNDKKEILQFII